MQLTNQIYRQYENIVHKATNKIVSQYRAYDEKEDVRARAMLIFCKSVESFDNKLGQFSTHLTNQLQALSHDFDSRSKNLQRKKANISMSTEVWGNSSSESSYTLEDKLGCMDANISNSEIWEFLKTVGDSDLCDLAFEICFGDLDRKITKSGVIAWGLEKKGWSRKESLEKREELIDVMKLWNKIVQS